MHTRKFGAAARPLAVIAAALVAQAAVAADLTTRKELGRADNVSDAQMETIVTELRMMPGANIPLHKHPGDEHVYIVRGGPMGTRDGKTLDFKDGDYLMFPRGLVHGGLTAGGDGEIVVVTIHVVDKGKPVFEMAE